MRKTAPDAPADEIVELTRALVRIPSRGGEDDLRPVLDRVGSWLSASGLAWETLHPVLCLDATVDTAPMGRLDAWRHPPFSAVVDGRRLFGRGRRTPRLPGHREVVIGARGFYRATVHVSGTAGHSGDPVAWSRDNAVLKLGRLVELLAKAPLPRETAADFRFGPRLSVTEIAGGGGWSQVPSSAQASVDLRLTPHFGADAARTVIERCLGRLDRHWPSETPSRFEEVATWPCYRLDRRSPWVRILRGCAQDALGRRVLAVLCGPSNIGNYLAAHGVPAVCGFGVAFGNVHAADEFIDFDTIAPVYRAYLDAVVKWAALP